MTAGVPDLVIHGTWNEVFLTTNAAQRYLLPAVDQGGQVLDILAQSCLNRKAAKKFFRNLLKGLIWRHMQGCKSLGHAQYFLARCSPSLG